MQNKKTGQLIFALGLLGIGILIVAAAFFQQLFVETFPNAFSETPQTVTSEELGFDPLVTVVPEEERFPAVPKPLATDPTRGAGNPVVTVIEFGDFECENCAAMKPVVEQLLAEYPDQVQHVWKDFPLPSLHLFSEDAAKAARCAQEQDAFWQYHDLLLDRQKTFALQPWIDLAVELGLNEDDFTTCVNNGGTPQTVTEGFLIARSLELEETPSYYINNQRLTGVQSIEDLRTAVEKALQE